jgi:VWFA-related protein
MQKIVGFAALCASCWTLAGVAVAQNAAPTDTGTVIRTTVSEVSLDLVVRDKKGKVVKNLKPGDLQVYEDGVLQPLVDFRLVTGPGAPEKASAQTAAPSSSGTPAKSKPVSLPLRALNVVCIVFQNLDPNTKKWAVDATKEFLQSDLPADAWVGIFNLSSRLNVLQRFTTDRNALIQAAKNAFTGPSLDFVSAANTVLSMNPAVVTADQNGMNISGGELFTRAIGDVNVETSQSADFQRADLASQNRQFSHIEASRQTDQIIAMIQQFATLPGHKTVLLMTPGLTSTGDPDRFKKILTTASNAKITFYGIDVHGLSENSTAMAGASALSHVGALSQGQGSTGSSNAAVPANRGGNTTAPTTPTGAAGAAMAEMRQDDELHNAVRGSDPQAALRALSEGTGGFLIANTNDLRKPFQRIVDDVDSHYEAVYHPASAKYDGRLHKIEIKTARTDLTVETRAGYFAMPVIKGSPLKPFEVAALMTLSTKPLPHAFDFQLGAYQFRPQAENSQIGVAYEVPVSILTATPIPAQQKHRLHLALFALVKDGDGQVVDKFSQDFAYDIPDANLAEVQGQPISYSHPLSLPAGRYSIDSVLVDVEARHSTTGTMTFDNSERKGLSLSSVVVAKQIEQVVGAGDPTDPFQFQGRRVVPDMAAMLAPTAQPYLYFVVYPDKANTEKPAVQIQVTLDGQVVAEQEADLSAPDASGAIPVVIGGAPVKPGNYELRVTAVQGNDSVEQSVKYAVATQAEPTAPNAAAAAPAAQPPSTEPRP